MAAPLPAGMWDMPDAYWGKGPGVGAYDTSGPLFTATLTNPSPSNIVSLINKADATNTIVFVRLAGTRANWQNIDSSGCAIYDPVKYEARVRRFQPTSQGGQLSQADFDALSSAFARHRFIAFTMDEPNLGAYCDSISQQQVNNQGLLFKEIWPGVLTAIRIQASQLIRIPLGGFDGEWSGIDYTWFQANRASSTDGLTARQNYQKQKADSLSIDTGMVAGLNWPNGGDGRLWDCQNTGSSSCRIVGPEPKTPPFYVVSPDEIKEHADAVFDDPDVPAFIWWTTTVDCVGNSWCENDVQEFRSDYVAAFDYALNKFASRPVSNGLRQAKGTVVEPPPPAGLTPIVEIGTIEAVGDTVAVPAHQANDLVLIGAYSRGTGTVPSLPSGFTSINGTANGDVAIRNAWNIDESNDVSTVVVPNASGIFCTVLRHAHPTTPVGAKAINSGNNSTVNFPAITLNVVDKTSRVVGMAVHSLASNLNQAPAGMSSLVSSGSAGLNMSEGADTWLAQDLSVNASGAWKSASYEIVADPAAAAAAVAPTLALIADQTIPEQSTLSFAVSATDPDTDPAALTFSVTSGPGTVSLHTGQYSYTPAVGASSGSPYSVTIQVCDDTSPTPLCDSKTFSLSVTSSIGGSGSLTLVGSASAAGSSVAVPVHQIGDLIVISAFNDANSTFPSLAAGYNSILGGLAGTAVAVRTGYRVATATNDTSGTWTNATSVHVEVYRDVDPVTPVGASAGLGNASDNQIVYPDLALQVPDGSSWVHAAVVHQNATNSNTPPAGLVNRTGVVAHGNTFDSNGGVTAWNDVTVPVNATGARRVHLVEIRANPASTGESPVLTTIGAKSVVEQQLLAFTAAATDPDTPVANLTFSLDAGGPAGATVSPTGVFTWTPPAGGASGSPYSATIRVSDGTHEDSETISITVTAPVTQATIRGDGRSQPRQRSTMGAQ